MTPEQELAALELTRRVSAIFLAEMASEWEGRHHYRAAAGLRQLAESLRHDDPGTILLLREAVQQAASGPSE